MSNIQSYSNNPERSHYDHTTKCLVRPVPKHFDRLHNITVLLKKKKLEAKTDSQQFAATKNLMNSFNQVPFI